MAGACLWSHVHHARVVHGIAGGHMALLAWMHHLRLLRAPAMQHRATHLQQHRGVEDLESHKSQIRREKSANIIKAGRVSTLCMCQKATSSMK